MSMIVTVLLLLWSTLIGIVSKWSLRLPTRPQGAEPLEGDVVIRHPKGFFPCRPLRRQGKCSGLVVPLLPPRRAARP